MHATPATQSTDDRDKRIDRLAYGLLGGTAVGTLGGLIGLGGAEFRLPLLIGMFGFVALQAVVLNKTMSLVVVISALVFRTREVPVDVLMQHWPVAVNLLAGSVVGAWFGASWATRMSSRTLYRTLSVLLVLIAIVLVLGHSKATADPLLVGTAQIMAGVIAGFGIGVVASIMGVAGGELLIPTLVLLFGLDIKTAGSMSLAVSLPTMLVGIVRYSRSQAFVVIGQNWRFGLAMAIGSVAGAAIGGRLLGIVPSTILMPLLAVILLISAFKVWRHP